MMEDVSRIRLGVNIDHVATLRNARGTFYPDPLKMVKTLEKLKVDGITLHLREDRRHIIDTDVIRIIKETKLPVNLEMAATEEMQSIATDLVPNAVCLVPERREERTTEGGLDVISEEEKLKSFLRPLAEKKIRISLFVSPELKQIEAASRVGATIVELNTGTFCDLLVEEKKEEYLIEFKKLKKAANFGKKLNLEIHGGHGLTYESVKYIASIPEMKELNIGHFLISESVFNGIEKTIYKMRKEIDKLGYQIIMIGHKNHPETIGTMGQLPDGEVLLVENVKDVGIIKPRNEEKLAYITQTTLSVDDTLEIANALVSRFPSIVAPHKEDICYATTNRQNAVKKISPLIDGLLVVGSTNSSNSKRLVEVGKKAGCRYSQLIDNVYDIDWRSISGSKSIGLTAGASAPDVLINQVIEEFKKRYKATIKFIEITKEDIHFKIPSSIRN